MKYSLASNHQTLFIGSIIEFCINFPTSKLLTHIYDCWIQLETYRMDRINKILVANRGEIALRIMRTCRVLGIATVAVYSEVDRKSAHVVYADEAYCIGPAPSLDSYLNVENIMDTVKKSNANAVHPGYGFLSERAELAHACQKQGTVFIGPSAKSIEQMGDKMVARQLMQSNEVPVIPGTVNAVNNAEDALKIAERIGYPVLAKAAAGGGGKRNANRSQFCGHGASAQVVSE